VILSVMMSLLSWNAC
jgi:hypothetical protein